LERSEVKGNEIHKMNEMKRHATNAWMNEWMNEWMSEWMSEWTNDWTNECMNDWKFESMNK
jgi:hypothetical protein